MIRRLLTAVHAWFAVGAFLVGSVVIPLPQVMPSIINSNILLVGPDASLDEDVYATAATARIEGIIDGDLVIAANDVFVSGEIRGDLIAAVSGSVVVSGLVDGAVRGVAREVVVESTGRIADDLFVVSGGATIEGSVDRDAIVFAGSVLVDGEVGRDLRGRFVSGEVDGEVGRDIDIVVSQLTLGANAVIGGDVLYRSAVDAETSAGARVGGQFLRLPTRASFAVEVGVTIATIVGFLGFLLIGIVLFWLLRDTGPRAAGAVLTRPWRVLGVGFATVILTPVVIVVFVATLVGIPIAILLLVLLGLGLVIGPIPALTAFGDRVLRGRGGIFGAFLVGAVLWRGIVWLIPAIGLALYLAALVWGVGGWGVAGWERRKLSIENAPDLLPASIRPGPAEPPADWEPPLPPAPDRLVDDAAAAGEEE